MAERPATLSAQRLNKAFVASLALLVVASALHFFAVPTADNDLWGHILFGRRILAEGYLPRTNDYSYTAPDHEWINHEILAEIALAWVYDRFGSGGLSVLRWLVGVAVLASLAAIARRREAGALATGLALVFATSLMSFGFLARPQIFTFLFLALIWNVIDRAAEDRTSRATLWIAPIVALWVNVHGGVLAGLGIFAVAAPFLARGRVLWTSCAVAVALVALFANPYGWKLPAFLVHDVTIDRPIGEWAPISLFDVSNLQFKLACAAVVLGWTFVGIRRRPWEAAVLAVAALATFRHERHLPLFAVLATPHLALTFHEMLRRIGFERPSGATRFAIAGSALVIAVLQLSSAFALHRRLEFGLLVPRELYPVAAVRYVRENGQGGNLAVPFDWGEYTLWHLAPAYRVSIDGRYTTAYPEDVIELAWRYESGEPGWDRLLEHASVALADNRAATAKRLREQPGWRLAYVDAIASVFVRNAGASSQTVQGGPPESFAPSLFP